jgi:hypothetical protein
MRRTWKAKGRTRKCCWVASAPLLAALRERRRGNAPALRPLLEAAVRHNLWPVICDWLRKRIRGYYPSDS